MADQKEQSDEKDMDDRKELESQDEEWIEIETRMTKIGLGQYCKVVKENGVTTLDQAIGYTREDLMQIMGFKFGHALRFKREFPTECTYISFVFFITN